MALLFVVATSKTALVAGDRVLVSLDAALVVSVDSGAQQLIVLGRLWSLLLPAKGQVSGRDYLDEVHEVVRLLVGNLVGVVERVDVVVGPSARPSVLVLLLHVFDHHVAQLGTKANMVDLVCKGMRVLVLEVILEVVYVHVSGRERLSRRDVEVADNLVDSNATLETATFLTLFVEMFGVVFALALLHSLAATKRPRYRGVCVADIVAGVTAVGLDGIGRSRRTIALSTVIGVEMLRFVLVSRQC